MAIIVMQFQGLNKLVDLVVENISNFFVNVKAVISCSSESININLCDQLLKLESSYTMRRIFAFCAAP